MKRKCISTQLVIPASFAECFTYEKQILWLKKQIDTLASGGDPEAITDLQNKLASLTNRVNMLDSTVDSNKEEVDNQIADIAKQIAELSQSLTNYATKESLNDYVTSNAFETTVSTLSTKEELEDAVDILATKEALNAGLAGKQNTLTFDTTPTFGSTNPVTSGGVYTAIQEGGGSTITLDDTVTAVSSNGVKSSGIYSFVESETVNLATKAELEPLATKEELVPLATKTELSDAIVPLATKEELASYTTNTELTNAIAPLATKEELVPLATKTELSEAIVPLATKAELEPLAAKEELTSYATKADLEPLATIDSLNSGLSRKQNTLTFDTTPIANSTNPVTSDGIYRAIQAGGGGTVELDDTVTADSSNGVKSSGIYSFVESETVDLATKDELVSGLSTKQDTLTFDMTPIAASMNPVASDGILAFGREIESKSQTYANTKISEALGEYTTTEQLSETYATRDDLNTGLGDKQDSLTFDSEPTEDSNNPVTSGGIYTAIQAGGGSVTLDDTVTADSSNGVKSSGIYSFVNDTNETFATKEDLEPLATTESLVSGLAGKQDTLKFDATPTEDSNNPVTSGGIYTAIQAGGGSVTLDDTVTADSSNGVKSSGIYTFTTGMIDSSAAGIYSNLEKNFYLKSKIYSNNAVIFNIGDTQYKANIYEIVTGNNSFPGARLGYCELELPGVTITNTTELKQIYYINNNTDAKIQILGGVLRWNNTHFGKLVYDSFTTTNDYAAMIYKVAMYTSLNFSNTNYGKLYITMLLFD